MLKFQEVYECYAPDIYRFALWLAGDSFEAADITSETFMRAWARNGTIRTETLKAYLFTIARNVYLESKRKRKPQIALEDVFTEPSAGPDKQIESRSELLRVQKFLQHLPEIDQEAFVLRVQHELPYDEIARVLGLSLASVKVKIHRVRKKLLLTFIGEEDYK